ncbi:MAG: type IV toxin-antitoxin system AbiEi family antitoxin [Solirubrobacterales bacterium]
MTLKVGPRRATLSLDGAQIAGFDVLYEPTLTLGQARELALSQARETLVAFGEASPQARKTLRDAGASYASETGEIYIHAPPVHIEVPGRSRALARGGIGTSMGAGPAPFGLRGGRVPRWLLLNADAKPTFGELARAVELSESNVSRTVHGLAAEGLVRVGHDPFDDRRRFVLVDRPRRLLEALERAWLSRRLRSMTVTVGASDAQEGERILTRAAERIDRRYTVGGLLGAERLTSAVQPASVTAWVASTDLEAWADALDGHPTRPHPGTITLSVAPDPFVLSMGFDRDGVHIADPVQLYLDCRRSGERALEAAEAIRTEMGW